ncbi:hypothetical protein EV147_2855 [Cupriavidus agavae]|uniref:Uncharacterized protein n=1 Tax=Cupriavidus agavae TaxID=1001822 RepID=A0A4V2FGY4_9BURK|nr:hypothetical protein EV147_2855 [Cupriavidus agavae]
MLIKYRYKFQWVQRKLIPSVDLTNYGKAIHTGLRIGLNQTAGITLCLAPDYYEIESPRPISKTERRAVGSAIAKESPSLCKRAMKFVNYTCGKTGEPRQARQLFRLVK